MTLSYKFLITSMIVIVSSSVSAKVEIPMHLTKPDATNSNRIGIGVIIAQDTPHGLLLTSNMHNLPSGIHGFHLHQNPSCKNAGKDAGGHFDPENSGKHLGPYNSDGHLGDLPVLIVDKNGKSTMPILAPRLREADLKKHALIIHANADNYSDRPQKLGGGGSRIACGVIK